MKKPEVAAVIGAAPSRKRELTKREREIVIQLCNCNTNDEIAELIEVAPKTVETHIANIMNKLGFRRRASIIIYAIKTKLVEVDKLKLR